MPKFFDSISDDLAAWAMKQPVFFTASAPLTGRHINISPKGLPSSTFTVLSPNTAAYIDATGSGSETIAHVYENGRVTIMFCSFGSSPRIMRFFCTARVVEWDQPEFETLLTKMSKKHVEGARAIIFLDVFKVQTSCGYGVPRLSREHASSADIEKSPELAFEDRETMGHWASKKVENNELAAYRMVWNVRSLDGLHGLRSARRDQGQWIWLEDFKTHLKSLLAQKEAIALGMIIGAVVILGIQAFKRP
ncbi:pyridoxamine phosphate oxidase family protein [Xylogone sp. PMI_703]|nr:pyridoxamine phosphate oxidase family protein [Xylogone sp. PMI_703]